MVLGLKGAKVELADHDLEWETLAAHTIEQLWRVFGSTATDIQHIGSTAIRRIKAKPIIDIAVGVQSFEVLAEVLPRLEASGYKRSFNRFNDDMLYTKGDFENDTTTHYIHILMIESMQWRNYTDFRDYLNNCPKKAVEYEALKNDLAQRYPEVKKSYTDGKKEFMDECLFEARIYAEMRQSLDILAFEPITKGWSSDKKYYIKTADGKRMLLRVSDIAELDRKKAEYGMMERVYVLGVLTSKPFGFGLCDGGKSVYSLSGWLDGEDAEIALPLMSETEQYVLGTKAGEMLRMIHTLPAPEYAETWGVRFRRKVQERVDFYNANPIKSKNGDIIVRYLQDSQHLLDGRPQTFNHGDYGVSNMMVAPDGRVGVIDFNYFNSDHGDPWWEFDSIPWGTEPSAHFYTGFIKGYFDGELPHDFFKVFSYYLAYDALAALCDTSKGEQGEPQDGRRHMENILRWFDNMNNPVPTWYLKDFYIQWIDGVPYKLKAPFDFSFLSRYGKVFKVFDDQGSGNICFGIEDGDSRYFVKFAGAPTKKYTSTAEGAIERLKAAVPAYQDLAHPTLIRLVKTEEIGGGFAVVFDWVDAVCMHKMYPNDHQRFKQLPLNTRLQIFKEILDFHAHAASKGYNAYDFYDASIMWDYINERAVICDIDFYSKSWYEGMAGLWNDSKFASPEECTNGAKIDEISTVYNMGGTAFALFSNFDRSPEAWPFSPELYTVVKRAVSDERGKRQQSIGQLITEWRAAK